MYLDVPENFEGLLEVTNTRYLTRGLTSLKQIPTSSIDVVISNAVLEHILLDEFEYTISELFRIQKQGGITYHRVDFKDHLSRSLNSLRFSKQLWESSLFAKSGFYTNRLRAIDVVRSFKNQGYKIVSVRYDRWARIPLDRKLMSKDFQKYSDEDLLISGMDLQAIKQ